MSSVVWFGTVQDFNIYLEEEWPITSFNISSPSFSLCHKAVSYERLPLELQYEIVEVGLKLEAGHHVGYDN
jgi:hypothetical protein